MSAPAVTHSAVAPREVPWSVIVCTALGAVVLLAGAIADPRRAAVAYLTAYMAVLAVVLGMLAMVMIAHLTNATWFVVLRRQAEQVVATLPILAVLFIPLILWLRLLYPWATDHSLLPYAVRAAIDAKRAYLNLPFFFIRAGIYWVTWLVLGELLRRTSLRQDLGDDVDGTTRRLRMTSAAGLPLFALTSTFAAFDWMMSLTPTWYSTIYGVDYFAGAMVGALALLAFLIAHGKRRGVLPEQIGVKQMRQLANLLLTFLLFWVYIGYSQFIVIWSGEVPAEVTWYVARTRGVWDGLAGVLLVGHFAIPFALLLLRAVKRSVNVLAWLGLWLLVMHYLDLYWTVIPGTIHRSFALVWIDLAALAFIVGAVICSWAVRRAGEPMLATGDPRLAESLAYVARNTAEEESRE